MGTPQEQEKEIDVWIILLQLDPGNGTFSQLEQGSEQ